MSHYVAGGLVAVLLLYLASTCSAVVQTEACATPAPGSNAQDLESTAVVGEPGRQAASFVWTGPFDFTIRQAQFPPAVSADPAGASQTTVDLFPATRATLVERYDGSGDAFYHLQWQERGIHYELFGNGPPQQRRIILQIARSLE